jgi:hypothetical protein
VASYGSTQTLSHVALLASPGQVFVGQPCDVMEMGPPIHLNPSGTMSPQVAAWMPLTNDEVESIEAWIADLTTQTQTLAYCALPAWQRTVETTTGRQIGWRFSCAGFVFCAYQAAGITLLDEVSIPPVPYATVRDGWIHLAKGRDDILRAVLEKCGISGPGPWAVMLPGYIVHALAGQPGPLPHVPVPSECTFP